MSREPSPPPGSRPDWKLIAAQMTLYGFKDGLSPHEIEREVAATIRRMKREFRETGKRPQGWEDYVL